MNKKTHLSFPIYINIYITNTCNLSCRHCIDNAGPLTKEEARKELSDKEIYELLDYLIKNGAFNFSFSGGEPLLKEGLLNFIRYLHKNKCKVTLLSNLTLLNGNIIKKLFKSGVNYIRTSLEGDNPETHDYIRGKGNFNLLMEKFKLLSKLPDIKKGISVTITKRNIHQIEGIINILKRYKFTELTFSLFIPTGRGKYISTLMISKNQFIDFLDDIEKLKQAHKDINFHFEHPLRALYYYTKNNLKYLNCSPCLIGRSFLGFKANGDVYACPMRDTVIIGNCKKDNIKHLWENSPILNSIRNLSSLTGKCSTCPIKLNCGGGCRAFAHLEFDNFCRPDPYCWRKIKWEKQF